MFLRDLLETISGSPVLSSGPPIAAVALAPVPPPPVKLTVGALVYPEPQLVTTIPVTLPPDTVAVATAPDPPPPEKVTVGELVYPEPPLFTVTLATD